MKVRIRLFLLSRIALKGLVFFILLVWIGGGSTTSAFQEPAGSVSGPILPGDPWIEKDLIYPDELSKSLAARSRPVILYVGPPTLFKLGHIPEAKAAGMGSTAEGLQEFKKTVQGLKPDQEVVLYCGCCPWKNCPNIRPTFKILREMKFAHMKILYLPERFPKDWAEKGLPVEKGCGSMNWSVVPPSGGL